MSESAADYIRRSLARPPFHQWLRPELVHADETTGDVTIVLPIRDEFRRDPERPEVHGGVIAWLIDIAGHARVEAK
jgi:acyl-coenzyme A thioesterase PaaI-like protein